MKKFTKTIILLMLVNFTVKAQTNVSGGIYTNTTWSLTGSPYIITDTVVVFPGVTLSILPGVIVKFNYKAQIELRQSAINAWGNAADSITFTSNTTYTAGSYSGIYLTGGTMTPKFNYCIFKYADVAITDQRGGSGDTIIIKNSSFSLNNSGVFGQGTSYGIIDTCNFRHNVSYGLLHNYGGRFNYCDISYNGVGFDCDNNNKLNNCTITHNHTGLSSMSGSLVNNSTISYNQTGINVANMSVSIKNSIINSNSTVGVLLNGNGGDTVYNCQLLNNGVAINDNIGSGSYPCYIVKNGIVSNTTGIQLKGTLDYISCNKICNNSSYDLQYLGTNNVTVAGNYWCTADSASTETVIYDGYDNTNYGLVKFMPIDTACNSTVGIAIYQTQNFSFKAYPNPATNNLVIELPTDISKADIKIFNLLGDIVYTTSATKQQTNIDISALATGIYIIQTTAGGNTVKKKFIKQ